MPPMGCFMPSNFNVQSTSAYEQLMGRWSKMLALPFLEFAGLKRGTDSRRRLRQWQPDLRARRGGRAPRDRRDRLFDPVR